MKHRHPQRRTQQMLFRGVLGDPGVSFYNTEEFGDPVVAYSALLTVEEWKQCSSDLIHADF